MKRTIAFLLALLLVFSLAACGEKKEKEVVNKEEVNNDAPLHREDEPKQEQPKEQEQPKQSEQQEKQTEITQPENTAAETAAVDLDAVREGNGDTQIILAKQDEETKKSFVEAEKEDGAEVIFGDDGTTTIKDANGDVYVQSPDGSWTFSSGEAEAQLDFSWPDNEFTGQVPKPGFMVSIAQTDGGEFTAVFSDPTIDQIKAYVEELKAAGFTEDASLTDQTVGTMTIYSYSASNAAGYTAEVVYTPQTSGMTVTK